MTEYRILLWNEDRQMRNDHHTIHFQNPYLKKILQGSEYPNKADQGDIENMQSEQHTVFVFEGVIFL
jgi:hypothetical protein